jgi:uncharacterized protein
MRAEPSREWSAALDDTAQTRAQVSAQTPAQARADWRSFPFREFILKVHSRCDLACDYCYMYTMADQSWRAQPRRMSPAIARQSALRIGEHARGHGLTQISVVLHGGEPLLAGPDLIADVVGAVRTAAGTGVRVDACVQTNGVRLDERFLMLFSDLGVRVGVSLDGDADAQDRHRRHPGGRGSHREVSASLGLLGSDRYRHLFSGLLSVIDLRNDPLATYEALLVTAPPRIDFLLPHGTWDDPPPGRVPGGTATPYADWLIAVFDDWYLNPRTQIRLFTEIMRALLGGTSGVESIGVAPAGCVVIETSGAIEQVDTLKAAFHGAADTGLHVLRDPLDAALRLPQMKARQAGISALCSTCQDCRIRQVCGGGLYAHRYRAGTGFANPSVYCPDLMRLIDHISQTMEADIRQRLAEREDR